MSDTNRYTGTITVTPPLTALELRDAPDTRDARFRIEETTVETEFGRAILCVGTAIESTCDGMGGRLFETDMQALVDYVDTLDAPREFAGYIEVSPLPAPRRPAAPARTSPAPTMVSRSPAAAASVTSTRSPDVSDQGHRRYGDCTKCGQSYQLRLDGTLRHHRTRLPGGGRGLMTCLGSGKKPKPAYRFRGDVMTGPHNEPKL